MTSIKRKCKYIRIAYVNVNRVCNSNTYMCFSGAQQCQARVFKNETHYTSSDSRSTHTL